MEPRRLFCQASAALIFALGGCSNEPHGGSFESILALGHCVGTVVAKDILLVPAHCLAVRGATNAYGGKLAVRDCISHPEASLGAGTDFAFCALSGASPLPIPVADVPKEILSAFLIQRRAGAFRSYPIQYGGGASNDLVFRIPADAFCPGDSGAPIVVESAGQVAMVAMASSRARGTDCHSNGELHAVAVAPALEWRTASP